MAAWCLGAMVACGGGTPRPLGPPPVYERPVLAPWDAGSSPTGSRKEDVDDGEWLDETEDAGAPDSAVEPTIPADGGPAESGAVLLDASPMRAHD